MVHNIVTKPLGLVLIVAAHMVFNGHSRAEVTGILSTSVTLQFTFNTSISNNSHFAVYTSAEKKIAEYSQGKVGAAFDVYPENTTVFYHITNLKLNDSGCYWASLFMDIGVPLKSNMVQLIVQEENRSSTVPPIQNYTSTSEGSGSFFTSHVVIVLVVSPVVLLAAVLPWLIWCLVRTNDKQQPPQQTSNYTVQETVEVSNIVPAPSLVYSVLDFPKRTSAVLEINPNDTEYAGVSYLPEKRGV